MDLLRVLKQSLKQSLNQNLDLLRVLNQSLKQSLNQNLDLLRVLNQSHEGLFPWCLCCCWCCVDKTWMKRVSGNFGRSSRLNWCLT